MPYVTYAYVAEQVDGEKRLRELLEGHPTDLAATAEGPRPFFDEQEANAEREVNNKLRRAGIVVPLTGTIDPIIQRATAAITVDLISQTDSNREPWIDRWATWARGYLDTIADGESDVLGAEETPIPFDDSEIEGTLLDAPIFDSLDPRARVTSVFRMLPIPRRR